MSVVLRGEQAAEHRTGAHTYTERHHQTLSSCRHRAGVCDIDTSIFDAISLFDSLSRNISLQVSCRLQTLTLCFLQLMLGVPEQALSVLHEAIEPVLAHGSVMDKGRALLLTARCQMAVAGFRPNGHGRAGTSTAPHPHTDLYNTVWCCTSSIYTLLLVVALQICIWRFWLLTL